MKPWVLIYEYSRETFPRKETFDTYQEVADRIAGLNAERIQSLHVYWRE
jgi:hypothetical protein